MNTQSRCMVYGVAVILVLFLSSTAMAQLSCGERGKRGEWGDKRAARQEKPDVVFKGLNLSPEQKQKIMDQRKQEKEQSKALKQKMADVRSQLKQELNQPVPDKAKAYSLIAEMKELIGKRMEQRVERIFALREILTPEQLKLLNQKTRHSGFKKGGLR